MKQILIAITGILALSASLTAQALIVSDADYCKFATQKYPNGSCETDYFNNSFGVRGFPSPEDKVILKCEDVEGRSIVVNEALDHFPDPVTFSFDYYKGDLGVEIFGNDIIGGQLLNVSFLKSGHVYLQNKDGVFRLLQAVGPIDDGSISVQKILELPSSLKAGDKVDGQVINVKRSFTFTPEKPDRPKMIKASCTVLADLPQDKFRPYSIYKDYFNEDFFLKHLP